MKQQICLLIIYFLIKFAGLNCLQCQVQRSGKAPVRLQFLSEDARGQYDSLLITTACDILFHHSFIRPPTCSFSQSVIIFHQSIQSSIHPSIHPSMDQSSHSSTCSSIHTSIPPLFHPIIHTSLHPPSHRSIHPPIHSISILIIHTLFHSPSHRSIHPPSRPFVHPFIHTVYPYHPFIYIPIYPAIHSSIDPHHPSIDPSIHLSIHSATCQFNDWLLMDFEFTWSIYWPSNQMWITGALAFDYQLNGPCLCPDILRRSYTRKYFRNN